ncbi:CHAT domain-containing protein [Candidatus Nitronereus thalassa]|uniref:CHAT domain-containing protein n=1 Tax=Candidatus Nitronereus thalassa TaxID=3020898 RepID=A0ABU3K9I1_9BACT|nr:CHAT domain-containing protein [Candidatus Nitronereus thalassa]MDT7043022.1 CHAT domain-containing protein [Candidatus Nitronereus thalassa]
MSVPSFAQTPQHPQEHFSKGISEFQNGKFEQAALSFSDAARSYEEDKKPNDQIQALTHLAESVYHLGQYQKALVTFQAALNLCKRVTSCVQQPILLGRIGNVLFAMGQTTPAIDYLKSALTLARRADNPSYTASLLNDLGNTLAADNRNAEAIAAYTEGIILSEGVGNESLAITALTNSAKTWVQEKDDEAAEQQLDLAQSRIQKLPDSHQKVALLVNFGMVFHDLSDSISPQKRHLKRKAASALESAAQIGERLGDHRMSSYAWGHLGRLYEAEGHVQEALQLTRRAVLTAQQANAPESLYQWEWQTGRLLRALNQPQEAIEAYQRAIGTLQPIRSEFSFSPKHTLLSFREKVGPLFFQLADLILKQADVATSISQSREWLLQARETVEAFKVAELQDYFRDDCVQATLAHIEKVDKISQKTTAILYPIILPNRLELLVSVAGQLYRQTVPIDEQTFTHEVRAFRRFLEKRTTNQYRPHAQQLYDWLIRPINSDLKQAGIDTLVIVPDGALRTIPIGALYDGEQFLIQHYALATTPGLTLTDPHPLNRESLKVLSVGLTKSVQGFPPLPSVADELKTLDELFQGKGLMNEQFVVSSLEQEMKKEPFSIVHIASHGSFASTSKDSFVLAFDEPLTMDRLDEIIGLYQFRDSPLDLLTLSACETAAGDDRAALGLAGVAIKAGARSALATLWFINDKVSSDLVSEFYTQLLDPSLSKAMALQRAQIKIIGDPTYQHPGYWAPFLLLNNWL